MFVRQCRQALIDERHASAGDDSRHVATRRHADDVRPAGVVRHAHDTRCGPHVVARAARRPCVRYGRSVASRSLRGCLAARPSTRTIAAKTSENSLVLMTKIALRGACAAGEAGTCATSARKTAALAIFVMRGLLPSPGASLVRSTGGFGTAHDSTTQRRPQGGPASLGGGHIPVDRSHII